jgi:hypothetical protein
LLAVGATQFQYVATRVADIIVESRPDRTGSHPQYFQRAFSLVQCLSDKQFREKSFLIHKLSDAASGETSQIIGRELNHSNQRDFDGPLMTEGDTDKMHRYFRMRRTVLQMLRDRGYEVIAKN